MVKRFASWRPLRLLTAPVLRLMDSLGKGSLMTVFCQLRQGTID
jgi:hypothetical protein